MLSRFAMRMEPIYRPAAPVSPNHQETQGEADRWLSKEEVLSMLYISERTLQRWRSQKLLNYSMVGKKIYYRRSDIEMLLESRRMYK